MNEQTERSENSIKTAGVIRTVILTAILAATSVFMIMHKILFADKKTIFICYLGMILAAFVFILVTWFLQRKSKGSIQDDGEMKGSPLGTVMLAVMFLLTPVILFLILTKSYGIPLKEIALRITTYAGLMNIAVIALICLGCYAVTNRLKASIVISTLFNLLFALVNYMLILFRGAPLMANDFVEIKTAAQVAGGYSFQFDEATCSAVLLSVIWIVICCSLDENRKLKLKQRLIVIPLCLICFACFYMFVLSGDTLSEHRIKVSGWDPERTYREHGYYISFLVSCKQLIIKRPQGYSTAWVKEISGKYESDPVSGKDEVSKSHPNIIAVMNESFADLECIGKIKTNEEVLPFYKSLKENVIKGTMHSSVYGGHTAVSEFEFLTGFSQRFMPLNSIPYSGILGSFDVPSLTWDLKDDGYGGLVAFHPGRAGAYNRNIVYPLFGFTRYIASRDMKHPKKIRGFTSDQSDYDRLIEEYEAYVNSGEKKPYYMFNVTIQNHGGFTNDVGVVKPHRIDILDPKLKDEEAENYLNLVKISDEQLERLVGYFSKVKEPTVIMMFGDHQPRIGKSFYKILNKREGRHSHLEKQEVKYRTPFMIWANFDIEEEDGIEISANYLSSFMLKKLGAPMTGYQKYLMDIYKELPVISDICTMDSDGKLYAPDEKTPHDDLLNEYQRLQYNAISDNDNIVRDFFYLKDEDKD